MPLCASRRSAAEVVSDRWVCCLTDTRHQFDGCLSERREVLARREVAKLPPLAGANFDYMVDVGYQ